MLAYFRALALPTFLFFALLLLAEAVGLADVERRRVMGLFYLSIPLTLALTLILKGVGKATFASNAPGFGLPFHRALVWGDFGRLYALLFLVFVGAIVAAALSALIAAPFVEFETTINLEDANLTEEEANAAIANGEIDMSAADEARLARLLTIATIGLVFGFAFMFTCFARLAPFFIWRFDGTIRPLLRDVWPRFGWGFGLLFGLGLYGSLAALFFSGLPFWATAALTSLVFLTWSLLLARRIRAYD